MGKWANSNMHVGINYVYCIYYANEYFEKKKRFHHIMKSLFSEYYFAVGNTLLGDISEQNKRSLKSTS
jgi:hypothetical protein